MKWKLKAKPQDWLIFFCFAILLLYLICIAVVNIHQLSIDATFAGLNPFPAFSSELIGATILFYVGALIFLFGSVSSYFFDKEKGFGISFGPKEEKGYSRWTKDKEMKKTLKEVNIKDDYYEYAGFPIVNDGIHMWVDDGESHNLVIGSTGTGKTQCIIHPLVKILAKKGESMIVTDPKGEIYRESASLLKEKGYKIVILNFRDPQRGNCWNPLSLPYNLYRNGNSDKAMELLDDLAANILYDEAGGASKDPFWEKTASDFFVGLALGLYGVLIGIIYYGLFEDAKPEEININSISLMATLGDEKFGPRSSYLKEYFNDKDPAGAAYTCASGTVYAPEDTKGSIVSTFKQKIRLFASRENLSEMLANSDFDMANIGKEKTAVFMIIQDEKKTYHALATIFIKQCYETLIDVAQNTSKGELPVRTNFILDEFANMPPLKDITTMITAARSRLIRFTMIIQNFAQLDAVYGKENAQTIRSNCNNLLYLLTTELAALKEISELCGEVKVKVGKGDKEREETRPLVTVSDLQKMKQFEAIIIRTRMNPFRTKLKANFQIDWGIKKGEADPFVQREKKPVAVFNLKNYVNEKRQASNPFMGASGGFNPFMNNSNPFAGFNNPFISNPNQDEVANSNLKTPNVPLNVDELVKRIDEKIAELEKEEQEKEAILKKNAKSLDSSKEKDFQEASASFKSNDNQYEDINLDFDYDNDNTNAFENNKDVELEAPTIEENNEDVSDIYKNSTKIKITDDQFFDDFFDG